MGKEGKGEDGGTGGEMEELKEKAGMEVEVAGMEVAEERAMVEAMEGGKEEGASRAGLEGAMATRRRGHRSRGGTR